MDYIQAAMRKAHYDFVEEDKVFYGEIAVTPGVWGTGQTLEACREELQQALEDWIIGSLQFNDPLPEIDGISIPKSKLSA
jgi:predicted RNase H-like HicB family nuclease